MFTFLRTYISRNSDLYKSALFVAIVLVVVKISIHLFTITNYGFHRDELLYLAVSERLTIFRNEFPPLIAIIGYLKQLLLGDSLFATRLLPALSGGAIILVAGLTVRELGGGRFAQTLTGTAILIAPLFLRSATLFQPVVFEQLLLTIACYLVVFIINRDTAWSWYLLGIVLGIGLLNKFTILIFASGVAAGLLLTSRRYLFYRKEPWIAGLIGLVLGLPGIIGQVVNDWPLFTHIEYISRTQFEVIGVSDFLLGQIVMLHPLTMPVWIGGLYYFMIHKNGNRFRIFSLCYVAVLLIFLIIGGKPYYLGPMYPVLIAGGAVLFESLMGRGKRLAAKTTIITVSILGGLYLLPIGIPVLPPDTLERYIQVAGLKETTKNNRGEYERIPQDFADMFGWEQQVEEVARLYFELMPEERSRTVIIAGNYGRAGAIDLFGKRYSLPKAISYVSSYHGWGPGDNPAEIAIAVGVSSSLLEHLYEQIQLKTQVTHEFAVSEEQNVPIYVCRRPKVELRAIWPDLKRP